MTKLYEIEAMEEYILARDTLCGICEEGFCFNGEWPMDVILKHHKEKIEKESKKMWNKAVDEGFIKADKIE